MSEFVLLRPWWLTAIPMVGILTLWLWRRGAESGHWDRLMSPAVSAAMRQLGHLDGSGGSVSLVLPAVLGLITIGLAGPAVPRADAPTPIGSGAILMALDLSPSVAEGPALADAKAAAAQVLTAANGRPVGLLLFAGEAYELSAPTADPQLLESDIAVLGPGVMPSGGSRPAAALSLAREMLTGAQSADVVVISDGGGMDTATATEARRLAASGVRLSILILEGAAGGTADVEAFASLATIAAPARTPQAVLNELSAGGKLGRGDVPATLGLQDLGPIVAGLAILPFLALFRGRS